MSSDQDLYRQSQRVLSRSVGSDVLLTTQERDDFDLLSGTAVVVWDCLEAPRTLEDLTRLLSDLHETSPVEIAGDVEALVRDLAGRGVVEKVVLGEV